MDGNASVSHTLDCCRQCVLQSSKMFTSLTNYFEFMCISGNMYRIFFALFFLVCTLYQNKLLNRINGYNIEFPVYNVVSMMELLSQRPHRQDKR